MSGNARQAKAMSVRSRLLNRANASGHRYDLLVHRYAIERLLMRLQESEFGQSFILKGAMVFLIWGVDLPRPTRDLDLMGFVKPDTQQLSRIFRQILSAPVDEDGLDFDQNSVTSQHIREENLYAGVRVNLMAKLGTMRIPLQIDVGTGDALFPAPTVQVFPSVIGLEGPRVRSYSRELVVAEKLEVMISLGEKNSRMKDFFDIWFLASHFEFEHETLAGAIRNTFARRGTAIPTVVPLPLTEIFFDDDMKQTQWLAFVRKSELSPVAPSLSGACRLIRDLVEPCFEIQDSAPLRSRTWSPEDQWQ